MNGTVECGIITKCLGGLYTVESPDGIYECTARGVFRNRGITPYAGDRVRLCDGVITEIAERKNSIIRPPLANLDQLIFVVSTCSPVPNYLLLDKFIAIAEYKGITPVVAVTGNSGAGKSTLLNAVDPTLNIPTAEISKKLGRGRHTTRHAELYKLADGGYIADTP